jgi:hypothetical protein
MVGVWQYTALENHSSIVFPQEFRVQQTHEEEQDKIQWKTAKQMKDPEQSLQSTSP